MQKKKTQLFSSLQRYTSLAVAFSGGVDSTLLLVVAHQVFGDKVTAFTARSVIHPSGELEAAEALALKLGVRHIVFETHEMQDIDFTSNSPQRCYYCKRKLFTILRQLADEMGIEAIAHGANADDLHDFRPGFKAAHELGIIAPLIDAGLTKMDVRQLAMQMELPNWDRPAMACLATRIPYGVEIQIDTLKRIDQAETIIRNKGIFQCRVRLHGDLARIEVIPQDFNRIMEPCFRQNLVDHLRTLGIAHICLDLEGYGSGKMNRGVDKYPL